MLPFCCHEGKLPLINGFTMRNFSGFRLFPLLDFDRIPYTPYSTNRITKRFSLYLVFILYTVFQISVSKRYQDFLDSSDCDLKAIIARSLSALSGIEAVFKISLHGISLN